MKLCLNSLCPRIFFKRENWKSACCDSLRYYFLLGEQLILPRCSKTSLETYTKGNQSFGLFTPREWMRNSRCLCSTSVQPHSLASLWPLPDHGCWDRQGRLELGLTAQCCSEEGVPCMCLEGTCCFGVPWCCSEDAWRWLYCPNEHI